MSDETQRETSDRPYAPGCGPLGYCPALYGRGEAMCRVSVAAAKQCQWPRCRKPVAGVGPAAKWCPEHAALSRKQAKRDYQRGYRNTRRDGRTVEKLTSASPASP